MEFPQPLRRCCIARSMVPEQVFCLIAQMFEISF
jgi:hypothetical protein